MQTKSPLVRIGIMAGAALAIFALFLSVQMHGRAAFLPAHRQQSYSCLGAARGSAQRRAEAKFQQRVRHRCRWRSKPTKVRRRRKFATSRTARAINYS